MTERERRERVTKRERRERERQCDWRVGRRDDWITSYLTGRGYFPDQSLLSRLQEHRADV